MSNALELDDSLGTIISQNLHDARSTLNTQLKMITHNEAELEMKNNLLENLKKEIQLKQLLVQNLERNIDRKNVHENPRVGEEISELKLKLHNINLECSSLQQEYSRLEKQYLCIDRNKRLLDLEYNSELKRLNIAEAAIQGFEKNESTLLSFIDENELSKVNEFEIKDIKKDIDALVDEIYLKEREIEYIDEGIKFAKYRQGIEKETMLFFQDKIREINSTYEAALSIGRMKINTENRRLNMDGENRNSNEVSKDERGYKRLLMLKEIKGVTLEVETMQKNIVYLRNHINGKRLKIKKLKQLLEAEKYKIKLAHRKAKRGSFSVLTRYRVSKKAIINKIHLEKHLLYKRRELIEKLKNKLLQIKMKSDRISEAEALIEKLDKKLYAKEKNFHTLDFKTMKELSDLEYKLKIGREQLENFEKYEFNLPIRRIEPASAQEVELLAEIREIESDLYDLKNKINIEKAIRQQQTQEMRDLNDRILLNTMKEEIISNEVREEVLQLDKQVESLTRTVESIEEIIRRKKSYLTEKKMEYMAIIDASGFKNKGNIIVIDPTEPARQDMRHHITKSQIFFTHYLSFINEIKFASEKLRACTSDFEKTKALNEWESKLHVLELYVRDLNCY